MSNFKINIPRISCIEKNNGRTNINTNTNTIIPDGTIQGLFVTPYTQSSIITSITTTEPIIIFSTQSKSIVNISYSGSGTFKLYLNRGSIHSALLHVQVISNSSPLTSLYVPFFVMSEGDTLSIVSSQIILLTFIVDSCLLFNDDIITEIIPSTLLSWTVPEHIYGVSQINGGIISKSILLINMGEFNPSYNDLFTYNPVNNDSTIILCRPTNGVQPIITSLQKGDVITWTSGLVSSIWLITYALY